MTFTFLRAETQRGAAAVHGGVANADDQHLLADLVEVLERHRLEPVDADVDVGAAFGAAGELELLALGRAAADEHRVETARLEQLAHAVDARVVADLRSHLLDVADFFGQHRFREAERRDVRAHQAARLVPLLEDHDFVAERQQVVGDRERRWARADAGHLLAVLLRRDHRQPGRDVVLVVGGHALQAADRDRLVLDPPAPAGRLAGTVANAAQDAWKHVGLAVDDVGV